MVDFIKLMDPKILKIEKSDQYFDDSSWLLEKKISGRRIQCLIDDNGEISFAGRYARDANENISDFRWKLSHIHDDLKKLKLPKQTLFDGEVYLPGRSESQTIQILNSSPDDAITLQQQYGFLVYIIFDVMFYEGKSLIQNSLNNRRNKLKKIINQSCNIELIEEITNSKEKRNHWKQLLESSSEEKGIIFKFAESEYESLRSKWWMKLKSFDTYDAVIMSFNFDKKYPTDFVSSIEVGQYRSQKLMHVANVSGLTKEQASDLRLNALNYIGKVLQFRSSLQTENSYKNPQFDRMRFDKQPQSCLWEI